MAKALGNLAMLYRERGELEDAAVLLQHALRLRERVSSCAAPLTRLPMCLRRTRRGSFCGSTTNPQT